jgi:NAD(P)-dependent dehydrogenase (short-subunit alcohol dehydrogenase family)
MPPAVPSLLDLGGQTVVVTGAGSGLGRSIARRFAEAGADVVVHYGSSEAGAARVVQEIEGLGRRALAVRADVTEPEDVERLFASAAKLGGVDLLVCNAGIYPTRPFLQLSVEEWDEMLDVNLRGSFLCGQAAARLMVEQGRGGSIVNVTSISGVNPAADHAHYNASKAGLELLTQSMAAELGPHGIRVNAVAPGLIWSETVEEDWPDGVARWRARAPLERLGEPDDVADACLFLASPAARWITGASLRVDGGVMARQIY